MARWICLLTGALVSAGAHSDLVTQVIDTGDGLAGVTRSPDGRIVVHDTGHYQGESAVVPAFRNCIGARDVDLLIVSHTDADHLGATDELFNEYWLHQVIRTSDGGGRGTSYTNHNHAINEAEAAGLAFDIILAERELPFGTELESGEATVTFLSGYHAQPNGWDLHGGEARTASVSWSGWPIRATRSYLLEMRWAGMRALRTTLRREVRGSVDWLHCSEVPH